MRKYIIIPEYAPLYAMNKCFGPTKGPLDKPTPCPVEIIGELLKQSGNEKVTIFETKFNENKKTLPPVQLNLDNYKLPYEEIVAMMEANNGEVPEEKSEGLHMEHVESPVTEVYPTIEPREVKEDEILESVEPADTSVVSEPISTEDLVTNDPETPSEEVSETIVNEEPTFEEKLRAIPEVEPDEIDKAMIAEAEAAAKEEEETPVEVLHGDTGASTAESAQEQFNKYAGMTKAERKAARRAEAAARAAEENKTAETTAVDAE